MNMKKLILSMFLWMVFLIPVDAKWANVADAPMKNSSIEEIFVNADGTYEATVESKREILNEVGRYPGSNIILHYNGDSEKIAILAAKTIYKGQEYFLDQDSIEDKPLASSPQGFDQKRQVLLAFPKAEVGATLYIKYKFIVKKPSLENFYAATFNFGDGDLDTNSLITIHSKIPLNILVNDPEHSLEVTRTKTEDMNHLVISLKKPIYKVVTNEVAPFIVDPKLLTWVSISSLNRWEDLAIKYGKLFDKVFTQKLPSNFVAILEKAKLKTSDFDKINTVTSLLNDKIRYLGDWRSVSGRLVPRDLDKVSETQVGDCKDFAAATAAILSRLGYNVQVVAVARGMLQVSPPILPGINAFNHAIVKVTNKDGKIYWIDPTNFESMSNGIFFDIADKMALILDPNNPGYEKIPAVNSASAATHLIRSFEVQSNNKIIEKGTLVLNNEETLGLTGSALKVSNETIKNAIFFSLAGGATLNEKNKLEMKLPELNSRIVKNLVIDYIFERENDVLLTNMGPAIKLTYFGAIPKLCNISQDNIADALIGNSPSTLTRRTIIKNININNVTSLNKELKTPWIYVRRSSKFNAKNELQIDDTIILYQYLISKDDFKKSEFINLKNWLKTNFKDIILVFENK
jgi:hypothetical protein